MTDLGRPFWDTSALVPLCCHQAGGDGLRRLVREHRRLTIWWGTRVEAHSALRRLVREGAISPDGFDQAAARLDLLLKSCSEVQPVDQVRTLAETLLGQHPLRSADALQLGAALLASQERPRKKAFVCLDDRLSDAARAVGFTVLPRRRT